MVKKKVGRPKKKKAENPKFVDDSVFNSLHPEFIFEDEFIIKADGEYDWCKRMMEADNAPINWCINSKLTVKHALGFCEMILEFHGNKSVIIVDFKSSNPDYMTNADIRCLNVFCEMNGWNKPAPISFLIKGNLDFWKHMWTTYQVDSLYLDQKYGERKILEG